MYSTISVAYILVRNVQELAVVRVAHGFSSAIVIPTAMAYVSEIASDGEEGKYMSTFNTSFLLGIGFRHILGRIIKDEFGMKFAFGMVLILTIEAVKMLYFYNSNL